MLTATLTHRSMNISARIGAILLAGAGIISSAHAQTGTLTVYGFVNKQTCEITHKNQAITLPEVPATELPIQNGLTRFSIEATGCFNSPRPGGPGRPIEIVVTTYFEPGGQVNPQTGRLRNLDPDGPANLELQLRYGNGQAFKIGEHVNPDLSVYPPLVESDTGVIATSHFDPDNPFPSSIRLNYSAEYTVTGGRVNPGRFNSFVTYTLEYH